MAWEQTNHSLTKVFTFSDFQEAFAFMTKLAMYAESVNHHPNWSNVYNQVTINLSTHDAGDVVTEKDHAFAEAADSFYHLISRS